MTSAGQSPTVAFARELIERLQREGGTVRIEAPDDQSRASYRRAIHAAKQHRLVPAGCQLKHTGRGEGELIIRLAADSPTEETDWNRIRLNTRRVTTDPGLVRTALEMNPAGLNVRPASAPRAINLLHELARVAADRNLRVGVNTKTRHPKVFLQVGTTRRDITVHEEYDMVPHVLTRDEQHALRRRPWLEFEEFDRVAAGRLRLEVARAGHGKVDTWTDGEGSPVERRLDRIVEQIEEGAAADERARLEQERVQQAHLAELDRREQERRRQWRADLDEARPLAEETVRRRLFGHAYEDWVAAANIRAFCEAIERGTPGRHQAQWIAWARAVADSIDPTVGKAALAHTEFAVIADADDLRPYIGDWSPSKPEKEHRSPQIQQRIEQTRQTTGTWHRYLGSHPTGWRAVEDPTPSGPQISARSTLQAVGSGRDFTELVAPHVAPRVTRR
jgi:hypothetical protein